MHKRWLTCTVLVHETKQLLFNMKMRLYMSVSHGDHWLLHLYSGQTIPKRYISFFLLLLLFLFFHIRWPCVCFEKKNNKRKPKNRYGSLFTRLQTNRCLLQIVLDTDRRLQKRKAKNLHFCREHRLRRRKVAELQGEGKQNKTKKWRRVTDTRASVDKRRESRRVWTPSRSSWKNKNTASRLCESLRRRPPTQRGTSRGWKNVQSKGSKAFILFCFLKSKLLPVSGLENWRGGCGEGGGGVQFSNGTWRWRRVFHSRRTMKRILVWRDAKKYE